MSIKASELILNPDGSIYHLNLKPENISDTIILVGDPDRVHHITKHFNHIEFETQKREFKTQTGTYDNKRITVLSTGIGCDNIDIVLNELDALVNIDFETRTIKNNFKALKIIRIGTSGSLQSDIPVDSFLISRLAIEFSGLFHTYDSEKICNSHLEEAFIKHTNWHKFKAKPVFVKNSRLLESQFESNDTFKGITATANGFYGPQGRVLRLQLQDDALNDKMDSFEYKGLRLTNLEMETAAIYGLSKLLGHQAISLNAIIANRVLGNFSKNPEEIIEKLIQYTLKKI
ncbi:phosphorylase [Pseudalgibacter alginicilyticus]|uniref:Uridine phosphorylase n=1 Tax=Pseudalgibacter alginicilyticus TaxID=1736674 RepID=A0A0P0CN86_9FLAO|nr:nucleoside phosphorylase [Pseudalgibacter alginicilyticus]ALJ04272.1 phosphorylase [Pseudalgibacter alginicilyticus]